MNDRLFRRKFIQLSSAGLAALPLGLKSPPVQAGPPAAGLLRGHWGQISNLSPANMYLSWNCCKLYANLYKKRWSVNDWLKLITLALILLAGSSSQTLYLSGRIDQLDARIDNLVERLARVESRLNIPAANDSSLVTNVQQ